MTIFTIIIAAVIVGFLLDLAFGFSRRGLPGKKPPKLDDSYFQSERWQLEYESDDLSTSIRNLDGIPWHEATIPPRFHKCSPQTRGNTSAGRVERCACGAIRLGPFDQWMERNSRRKEKIAA